LEKPAAPIGSFFLCCEGKGVEGKEYPPSLPEPEAEPVGEPVE